MSLAVGARRRRGAADLGGRLLVGEDEAVEQAESDDLLVAQLPELLWAIPVSTGSDERLLDRCFFSFYAHAPTPTPTNTATPTTMLTATATSKLAIRTSQLASYSGPTRGWALAQADLAAATGATKALLRMLITSLNATIYVDDVALWPT
jgi:hypothetical protein